jgi:hypothetical protein
MQEKTMLWRRLDTTGLETVRIYPDNEGWILDGAAIFVHEGKACRLEYLIECGDDWTTVLVSIDGWAGDEAIDIQIDAEEDGTWHLNGEEIDAVAGCVDIDLNFSPVTNLLPLKRLDIAVGESQPVRAAWLKFPSFELEPLEQTYTRLDETTVRYESGGKFVSELKINDDGLVIEYPDWSASVPLATSR